jgi:hypothetical protein
MIAAQDLFVHAKDLFIAAMLEMARMLWDCSNDGLCCYCLLRSLHTLPHNVSGTIIVFARPKLFFTATPNAKIVEIDGPVVAMHRDQCGSIFGISTICNAFIAEIDLPFRHMVASARH